MHESLPRRDQVRRMFDRISLRYDFLNRVLSFGRDVTWRRLLAASLPPNGPLCVLDIATGTGDVLLALLDACPQIAFALGADLSGGMLEKAQQKASRHMQGQRSALLGADALQLPFAARTFDVVTVAFGVRNFADLHAGLRELGRILKPGGHLIILEFGLPEPSLVRIPYMFYFRHLLPRIAGWISGAPEAYQYLNNSVECFPYAKAFLHCLDAAGFEGAQYQRLTGGIALLYTAAASSEETTPE